MQGRVKTSVQQVRRLELHAAAIVVVVIAVVTTAAVVALAVAT